MKRIIRWLKRNGWLPLTLADRERIHKMWLEMIEEECKMVEKMSEVSPYATGYDKNAQNHGVLP